MRFWSLNTVRSTCCQGMVFHSSIGFATVVMMYALLLTPLSSQKPGVRQLIPPITGGRLLLTPSYAQLACSLTAYSGCEDRRAQLRLSRSRSSFCVALGRYYAPGLMGVNPGQVWNCQVPSLTFWSSQ